MSREEIEARKEEMRPWEAVVINDLGDVPLPEANNNEILDEVGTRPVSYGGDHAITGSVLMFEMLSLIADYLQPERKQFEV